MSVYNYGSLITRPTMTLTGAYLKSPVSSYRIVGGTGDQLTLYSAANPLDSEKIGWKGAWFESTYCVFYSVCK